MDYQNYAMGSWVSGDGDGTPLFNAITGAEIGRDVYVGPGAAIRGDWGEIIIEDGCNIQENCTIHVFPGKSVVLRESAHIGHGAVIHGGKIGKNTLIGIIFERNE